MSATLGLEYYRAAFNRLALLCAQGVPFAAELAELTSAIAEWEEQEGLAVPRLALPARWQVYRVRRSCGEVVREGEAGRWPGLLAADACGAAAAQQGGKAWDYEAERILPCTLRLDEALYGVSVVLSGRGVAQLLLPDGLGLTQHLPPVGLYYLHVALRKAFATQLVTLDHESKSLSVALLRAVERVGTVRDSALVFNKSDLCAEGALSEARAALFGAVADALVAELSALPAPVPWRSGVPSVNLVAAHQRRGGWWQTVTSSGSFRLRHWVAHRGRVEEFDHGWVAVAEVESCRPCADDSWALPWPEEETRG